jgi:XTP/dITP diphosphohydrolase/tetrapyrrole methylase family protein/MazG family protein/ATP diphosphatase
VPHTVEEAYELADAAQRGDDAKLIDELGDVLFQVHFLSLLLEERGAGDLAAVAEHCRTKLVRRHPHVFGEEAARSAAGEGRRDAAPPSQDAPRRAPLTTGEVLANWDAIKAGEAGREPGLFGDVPDNLPGPLYARKVQRRAASGGVEIAEEDLHELVDRAEDFESVGDLLFACVALARRLKVDPELALRASADRFRSRLEPTT